MDAPVLTYGDVYRPWWHGPHELFLGLEAFPAGHPLSIATSALELVGLSSDTSVRSLRSTPLLVGVHSQYKLEFCIAKTDEQIWLFKCLCPI